MKDEVNKGEIIVHPANKEAHQNSGLLLLPFIIAPANTEAVELHDNSLIQLCRGHFPTKRVS